MTNNGPKDIYLVSYKCTCGSEVKINLGASAGQPFVQVPDLWCVKCEFSVPMDHTAPVKQDTPRIIRPVAVPNIGVKTP
jgi:hypothetical protein